MESRRFDQLARHHDELDDLVVAQHLQRRRSPDRACHHGSLEVTGVERGRRIDRRDRVRRPQPCVIGRAALQDLGDPDALRLPELGRATRGERSATGELEGGVAAVGEPRGAVRLAGDDVC
jgi:hypothetical protein